MTINYSFCPSDKSLIQQFISKTEYWRYLNCFVQNSSKSSHNQIMIL